MPGADVRLVEPDGSLPLGHGEVDLVWCSETLEHIPDVGHTLLEVRRVLRPGGRLLATVPYHPPIALVRFDRQFDPLGQHVRFFTRRSLARTLDAAGFAPSRVRRDGAMLRRSRRSGASDQPPAAARTRARRRRRRRCAAAVPRVEVVRHLEGLQRALGSLSTLSRNWPSRRHVSGLAGSRSIACSSARPAGVAAPRLLDRGQLEQRVDRSGLRSWAMLGDRRRRGRAHPARGARARRPGVDARAPAAARSTPRHGDREHERRGPAQARPSAGRARRPGASSAHAAGPRGDEARAQQRRHDVARDEPRPVDRRVQAEHDHDGRQRRDPDTLGVPRQTAIAPAQPKRTRAADEPRGGEQRETEPDPAEVRERLDDVAVRVPDDGARRRVAQPERAVGARSGSEQGACAWTSSASRQ